MNPIVLPIAQGSPWKYPWTPTWTASYWIPSVIGILCIVIVAVCYLVELRGVSLARRALFTMLRSTVILLLGWMLLGWSWTPYAEEPADLIVLIDSSKSMLTEDVEINDASKARSDIRKPGSRASATKLLLLSTDGAVNLREISDGYRPRVGHFGQETSWLSSDAIKQRSEIETLVTDASATRIGDAIHDALMLQRGRTAAAIIIFSDGVQTDGASLAGAAAEAKAASAPLYIVGLGDDRPARDVRITNLVYSPSVFLGDVVYIEADVETEGFAELTLRVGLKGAKESEVLAMESVTVRAGAASRVRLPIRPTELGDWKFTLEVDKPQGDANPQNNSANGQIRVQEETVRVLLVDWRPRYDFRYLTDVLTRARKRGAKSEPAFEVKAFLQEGDIGLSRQNPSALDAFPSREELAQYDVIVLGDIDPRLLGVASQRDLLEVVTHGGVGLVLLPSAKEGMSRWSDQPLELFLPVRATEIAATADQDSPRAIALSALGKQTPFCNLGDKAGESASAWQTTPPSAGFLTTIRLRPDVRVLAEASELKMEDGRPSPAVTMHFVGAGKVLCHWTDEWWRWAAPATRRYYDQYWMQAIRSLCSTKSPPGDERFELRADAITYQEGHPVRLSLHFRDETIAPSDNQGPVVALRSGEALQEMVLSREESRRDLFRGSVSDLPPGSYTASVVRPAVVNTKESELRFEVAARSNEAARIRPDFTALRSSATQSGGKFYTLVTADRLISQLPRGTAVRTSPLPARSAWNLPIWAGLMIGLLSLEWFLRRAGGLL